MSLVGYPMVIPIPSLNTLPTLDHSFLSFAADSNVNRTLILTLTQNHITCRISQVGSFVFQLCSEHFDISVKNALIDPVTLTFEPQNSITSRVSYRAYTEFDHFGIIRFFKVMLRINRQTDKQTNKQTNKQTDELKKSYQRRPT